MRKAMAALAVAMSVSAPAWATNGMRMIGFGPVQDSMGGASVAAPLDSATVATNPAGLLAVGHRLDLGVSYFSPSVEYSATDAGGGSVMSSATQSSDFGASFIPALGYVQPLSKRLAVGVGLYGAAGMGVDYPQNLYGGVTKSSYMQARLTPGVAFELVEGLTAGLTINAMYASMGYDVAGGMGMPERESSSALGIGAVVGVQFTKPMYTVGAAFETRSWFQDFSFDIPAHDQFDPASGTMVSFPGGTEKLAFDQPAVATLGVAFRPIEGLVLALDGEYVFWSTTSGENQPEVTNGQATGAMPFDLDWSNQLVLKVGAQYAVTRHVAVRLGYDYGNDPLDAARAFENIAFPAVAQHHFTAGVGVDVGNLTVLAAAMYSPESELSGSNPMQGIAAYTTKMSQLAFDLGVAYRF